MTSNYELMKAMRSFEELFFKGSKREAIKKKNGIRIMVKDSEKGLFFGEMKYGGENKNFYHMKLGGGKEIKLLYSNLERIFINGKKV